MNNQTQKALKMAIESLEKIASFTQSTNLLWWQIEARKPINACKEALDTEQVREDAVLAQEIVANIEYVKKQPAQEPYGWYDNHDIHTKKQSDESIALYTNPYQWQGLTDDVVASIWMHEAVPMNGQDFKRVYRAIEQALKEKNRG